MRQGSTSSLNKRTRKPRTEDAFRSIIAVPGDHRDQRDPLSLSLGGEFESRRRGGDAAADGGFPSHSPRYVPRGYPLAALERRGDASSPGGRSAASSSGGGGKGRRSTDYPYSGRHSPRYCPAGRHRDEMMASPPRDDDEQRRRPMTPPRQQRKPTGGGGGAPRADEFEVDRRTRGSAIPPRRERLRLLPLRLFPPPHRRRWSRTRDTFEIKATTTTTTTTNATACNR